MNKVRVGFVMSLNKGTGEGIIKEDNTQTTYIFFVDELSEREKKQVRTNCTVTFEADPEASQFIAINVKESASSYRKVM